MSEEVRSSRREKLYEVRQALVSGAYDSESATGGAEGEVGVPGADGEQIAQVDASTDNVVADPGVQAGSNEPGGAEEATEPAAHTVVEDPAPNQPPVVDLENDPRFLQTLAVMRDQQAAIQELKKQTQDLGSLRQDAALAQRIRNGDYSAVTELGGSVQDWSDAVLEGRMPAGGAQGYQQPQGGSADPLMQQLQAMRDEIKSLREERKQEKVQTQQQQAQEQLKQFQADIRSTIDSDPALRPLALAGQHQAVYDRIVQHFERTSLLGKPEVLDTKTAALAVQQDIVRQLKSELTKFRELDDFRDVFGNPAPAPKLNPAATTVMPAASVGGPPSEDPPRRLTREERMARAVAIAKGELQPGEP